MRRSPGRRSERMRACQWSPAANTRPRVGDTTRHYARRGGWATAFPTGLVDNVWIRRRVVWIAWGPRWGQPLDRSHNPALTWDDAIPRAVEEDSPPPFRPRQSNLTAPSFAPSSHRLVHAYPHRRPHPPHLWTTPVDKVPRSGEGEVDSVCARPRVLPVPTSPGRPGPPGTDDSRTSVTRPRVIGRNASTVLGWNPSSCRPPQ